MDNRGKSASKRMKLRWQGNRHEMEAVLGKANAQAGKRNRTRWAKDPQRMKECNQECR